MICGFVEDDSVCAQADPLYKQRMLQALGHIQKSISKSELTIQWDLPTEIAVMEYERGRLQDGYWEPYFSPVKEGVIKRLVKLAKAVDPEVEMGYHLCYGDFGHEHFIQPSNTGLLVELANSIINNIGAYHPIAYLQMPVPRNRMDELYFLPLKGLNCKVLDSFWALFMRTTSLGRSKDWRLHAISIQILQVLLPSVE